MKLTVIGCGRWGSFLTWYLDRLGHQVTLYGRPESKRFQEFSFSRSNGLVQLPSSVRLSSDLAEACAEARSVVISVPSQSLRGLMERLAQLQLQDRLVVLCMKGLDSETGPTVDPDRRTNAPAFQSYGCVAWTGACPGVLCRHSQLYGDR